MSLEITRSAPVAQEVWNVDPTLSRVRFEVGDKWGATKVLGRFERFTGSLVVRSASVEADLSIDAASLNTGNFQRDEHLRSMAFFAVDGHPKLTFEATSIVRGGRGLIITGVLAVRDRRVSLELSVESYESGDSLVLRATTSLSRQATGLDWNWLGMIRGDVTVKTELTLIREV